MRDEEIKTTQGGANVDFHTHSNYSMDGTKSIKQIIKRAHKNNTTMLGVTDHNSIIGVNHFLDKNGTGRDTVFDAVNGKTLLCPGVEITARIDCVKNIKGRPSKIHLVAYGIDRNDDSPISKLLKIKHINDKHVDHGFITQLGNHFSLSITDFDILQYNIYCQRNNHKIDGFGKQETIDFAKFMNYDLTQTDEELRAILDNFASIDRLNLEAKDVIDLVHASGGIVLLAHPHLNLRRTHHPQDIIKYLIENEIDGFELYYPQSTRESDIYLRKICKENNITLFSAGSDYHGEDSFCEEIHFEPIKTNKVQAFIDYLQNMNESRNKGDLIIKNYKHLHNDVNINEILDKYRRTFCTYEHLNKNTPYQEIWE